MAVETFMTCPGMRLYSMKSPAPAMNTVPSPETFCRISPSPPNRAAPNLRCMAMSMLTSSSAARNAVFCRSHCFPPLRSMGMILPGTLPTKPTRPGPPSAWKLVTKKDSPDNERFRPDISPPLALASMRTFPLMYIMLPASE
ncbi:MAG: hypothetical protein A4E29_01735 [Methanomassiliicoccales archaeon PtaB.Bin134]|nr:MAG: hypothetical protein A4E29_01735 [Methanomassiliicoccales archaeon PtaB.Bin134]